VETELVSRAMAAATSLAAALDLRVNDVAVIHNSNKLALRLLPCDVLARVALVGQEVSALEVELAQRLAAIASPVAALEARVDPRVYEGDGFAVTLWTYYVEVTADQLTSRIRRRAPSPARGDAKRRVGDAALHGSSRTGCAAGREPRRNPRAR